MLAEPKHITMTDRVVAGPGRARLADRASGATPTSRRSTSWRRSSGELDKENRLFRALMYDRQLAAQRLGACTRPAASGGQLRRRRSTPGPARRSTSWSRIADAEIERLKDEGPTADEVLKAQNTQESQLVVGLQSAGRKADFLNSYNVEFGDPLAYKAEMVKLFAVTPDDVKRVANQYLTANRVRLDVNPGPPTPRAPEVEVDRDGAGARWPARRSPRSRTTFDRSVMPKVGPNPEFTPPPVVRRKLSNGLEVLVAERHELPILTLNLVVKGGETLVPDGKEGLASLTADAADRGDDIARRARAGRRAVRDRRLARRQRRPRVEHARR